MPRNDRGSRKGMLRAKPVREEVWKTMNLSATTPKLLFSNVPPDCHDDYLWAWVEARGYRVSSLRLIRDQVSGTSPSFAHVQLMNAGKIDEAERALNGQDLGGRRVQVARFLPRTA